MYSCISQKFFLRKSFDPIVNSKEVKARIGMQIISKLNNSKNDLVIITVPHKFYKDLGINKIKLWCKKNGSLIDLKITFPQELVDYSI